MKQMLHPKVEADAKLGMPPANNLIPTNFEILPAEPEHSACPVLA
jgi:hypothetical protein